MSSVSIEPHMPRPFPAEAQRVESGPVQFGEDWPGVFIRGDYALYAASLLEGVLLGRESEFDRLILSGLVNLLRSCDARTDPTTEMQK